jgi:hypothetical protein
MNLQQYLALKSELAATVTLVRALAVEVDRLQQELHEVRQARGPGRPRKENGEIAATV